jgi:tellurite resistance-related uncharacterized protein
MQISTHTISGIELFDVKRINRATIADGDLLSAYVYEPLIQNEDILASAVGSAYNAIDYINHTLQDKKDKQDVISLSGSATKTIKNITQNANGEMTVEFQDIDLPPEVPNVELISTDDSISISATSVGNDVTYDLSVNFTSGDNAAKNYAFLRSEMPVNATEMPLEITDIETNGIQWNTIDQRLEFDEQIKLIDLNFNLSYEISDATGVSYEDLILYIYDDGQLLAQETFAIDTSIAKHICKLNKKILDPSTMQFMVKVPKAGSIDATIDVNDETFNSTVCNGSTYSAGPNINISNNVISGRDWSNELNTKLDNSAFTLPTSSNWNNTQIIVSSNSAKWDNTYTNLSSNSAKWDNVYSLVNGSSADWNEVSGKQDILFLGDTLSGLGTSASPLQAKPVQIVSNNHSITVSSNVLSGTSIFNIEAVNSTIVEASASTIGEVATVSIEQGDLYIVDLSEETTITDIEIVLTNNASVEFPFWWFKIESGSDATLSIKIGAVEVGWLGYAITNIELGKTIEVSVVDNVACGGELV